MRFMLIRKADACTEAEDLASFELVEAMTKYNDELVKAGAMLDGAGLKPSAQGARVQFTDGTPTVIDGPFADTKELIAGYTLIQARSLGEALEWVKRWPTLDGDGNVTIEVRPLYEDADFEPGGSQVRAS